MEKSDKLDEWTSIIKEDSNTYYDNTYLPWETKEQLRVWKEVIWSSWGNVYATTIQQNITSTTSITITCWFTPTYIKLDWVENWNPWSSSNTLYTMFDWRAIWSNLDWAYNWTYIVPTTADLNSTATALKLDEYNTANNIRARIENITSTWFDINFYEVEYSWYVTVIITCF